MVAGNYYEGSLNDKKWEELFHNTNELIKNGGYAGVLILIWYNEPEKEKGFARVFIGITLQEHEKAPSGFEIINVDMNGLIRVTIKAHPLVMPKPQKIAGKMKKFALENNLELQDLLIEKYPEESKVIAEIPVRGN
jgi:hypothetical protein